MEPFYVVVFGALAATAASFELTKGKTGSSEHASKEFWKFRTNYTLVYALMMGEAIEWRTFSKSYIHAKCRCTAWCVRKNSARCTDEMRHSRDKCHLLVVHAADNA